jgi:hypothetical protein
MARPALSEPPAYLGLAVVGLAAAAALTFGDMLWSGWPDDAQKFVGRGEAILWLALVFAQFGLWLGLQGPAWALASSVSAGERWRTSIPGLLALAMCLGLVVYLGSTIELAYPLPRHDVKLAILTAAGLVAIVPGVLTLWRAQRLASTQRARLGQPGWEAALAAAVERAPDTHPVIALERLREVVDTALIMLGLMLGAAVLSVAAFRNAVMSWYPPVAEGARSPFPTEYVFFYGGAFTVLLALLYVPALAGVRALCMRALDVLIPIDRNSTDWEDKLEERKRVEADLKLDVSIQSSLTSGIGILAPLLAGGLGLLLPS